MERTIIVVKTKLEKVPYWNFSVSFRECRLSFLYAPQMKLIHAFGGAFPVTEKVIFSFLYYYVIDNRRYI